MTKVPTTRIDRLLGSLGYGSRGQIAQIARARRIVLDGVPITDVARRIPMTPDLTERMTVHGAPLDPLPGVVVMLNKPPGYICSRKDSGPLVYDLLPDRWRHRKPMLSPVGRLDKETSGLLLLTDDGALLHRITSPNHAVEKTYRASLARPLEGHEVEVFASGALVLSGEKKPLHPAKLNVLSATEARLSITEGRYHQVRRMFAAVGNHVEALHREALGQLRLPDDLGEGAWVLLTEAEIASVFAK
ncbi:pseudouridine synthase [Sulfitobacter sp. S0837]|uniref:16S rRNA pseudouridine(516) synthase n=1 Tax=Sulfitobacter maritimus TaxID=2741719 RepID=UPI0015843D01|nr:16S rRNA pseudouridine(516) synthase [Sulfitobacter maritimus]NUH63925.1 pseudouridine synthase [Sulfitobacter maritimus]